MAVSFGPATIDDGAMPPDAEDALLMRITTNAQILDGRPIVRGHRLPVEHVLGRLAAGDSPEGILQCHAGLQLEDIRACLVYARRVVGSPGPALHMW
jgi:uncharacterized protein (DUF433 family)